MPSMEIEKKTSNKVTIEQELPRANHWFNGIANEDSIIYQLIGQRKKTYSIIASIKQLNLNNLFFYPSELVNN